MNPPLANLRLAALFDAEHAALMARYGTRLHALHEARVPIPAGLPPKWVVDCCHVGRGEPALQYLSRYLYRGVIREHDILGYDRLAGTVTFRYRDARTRQAAQRTLPIARFLWCVLSHVLPTGFRRVREYGFLHCRARRQLLLVQRVLHVLIRTMAPRPRPMLYCTRCRTPMVVVAVTARRQPDG